MLGEQFVDVKRKITGRRVVDIIEFAIETVLVALDRGSKGRKKINVI
jgi:hypothetical protein